MLRLTDATAGVDAALDLVDVIGGEGTLSAHAGVHAGPVIERDLDVFGQTVNLASRIADVAPPGEVLASRAVVEQAGNGDAYCFEQIEDADLKGVPDSVPLFRVARSRSAVGP
jgi:class 3 adenylate cyclase